MNLFHTTRYVIPAPRCLIALVAILFVGLRIIKANRLFGIADIVKVNAVNVIVFNNFFTDTSGSGEGFKPGDDYDWN